MDPFCVVEQEPFHEGDVEAFEIEKESLMIVNEFFLNGAVEAFDVGVHLRGLGVGVVVDDLQFKEPLSKVFLELGAVVREYECHRIWKHLTPLLKEVFRGLGSVRSGAPGKGESGMDVFAGDDVGSETMREAFDGIERDDVAGMQGLDVLGLPEGIQALRFEYLPFAVGTQRCRA